MGADINRGATATLTSVNIATNGTDGIGLDGTRMGIEERFWTVSTNQENGYWKETLPRGVVAVCSIFSLGVASERSEKRSLNTKHNLT